MKNFNKTTSKPISFFLSLLAPRSWKKINGPENVNHDQQLRMIFSSVAGLIIIEGNLRIIVFMQNNCMLISIKV